MLQYYVRSFGALSLYGNRKRKMSVILFLSSFFEIIAAIATAIVAFIMYSETRESKKKRDKDQTD